MARLLMLSAFAVLATTGTPQFSHAAYISTAFFELTAMADYVVVGTITDVQDETFVLSVDETLVGESQTQLEVQKFHDWMCAWRWAPYKVGQTVLVFIKKQDGKLELIGAGAESESHVVGDDAYCPFVPDPTSHVEHGRRRMTKLPLKDLRDAITNYRRCFRATLVERSRDATEESDPFMRFAKIESVCSREELEAYSKRSMTHGLLVSQTIEAQKRLQR